MTLTDSDRDRRRPTSNDEGGGVRVGGTERGGRSGSPGSPGAPGSPGSPGAPGSPGSPGATLTDRLLAAAGPVARRFGESTWTRAALAGFGAAVLGWAVLGTVALLGWVSASGTTTGWTQVLSVTSGVWFLSHGATVTVAGTAAAAGIAGTAPTAATPPASISLTPLGLLALIAVLDHLVIRRALRRLEARTPGTQFARGLLTRVVPGVLLGYLLAGAALYAIAATGPFAPSPSAVLLALWVPALVLVVALVRRALEGEGPPAIEAALDRLPLAVRRGLRPGLLGLGALMLAGALVLVVAVIARSATVAGLYGSLGVGGVEATVLTAGQLLLVPNLALWGLSVLAGPGFQVAAGSTISLTAAHPGLLPIVPVLGALPDEGTYPGWLQVMLLVPVACGVLIGWQACAAYSRLAGWRARLSVCLVAVLVAVLGLGLVTVVGVGSLGMDRLTAVGPSIGPLLIWVAGELIVGVTAYLLGDRLRRRLGR